MPFEMTDKDENTLRNIKTPINDLTFKSYIEITKTFTKLIIKLRNIRNKTHNNLKFFDAAITPNNKDVIITHNKHNTPLYLKITKFTNLMYLINKHIPDIKHEHLLDILTMKEHKPHEPLYYYKSILEYFDIKDKVRNAMDYDEDDHVVFYNLTNNTTKHLNKHSQAYTDNTNNIDAMTFIIQHNLIKNNINTHTINIILNTFKNIIDTTKAEKHNNNNLTNDINKLKLKYDGYIWIPVDKDSKCAACICQTRLHHTITTTFIDNGKLFKIIF